MKFVLINELYEKGGAEMQTRRERDILRNHGHEVLYITLDSQLPYGKMSDDINHWNISLEAVTNREKLQYRFLTNSRLRTELEQIIISFSPDYIHINNITDVRAISVYRVVKKYKTFQTIRDYNAVCPTSLCVTDSGEICEGFCSIRKCNRYCNKGYNKSIPSKIKKFLNRLSYIWQKHIRLRCINYFVAPSNCLTDYCNWHGFHTTCINNPFDFSLTEQLDLNEQVKYDGKIFLFYGLVAEHKGIFQLIEAFNMICKNNSDSTLYIAGSLDGACDEEFYSKINGNPRIVYLGKQKYMDIVELLSKVYAVVVPSLWLENYPNTVLEGIATKSMVIGSNRGGIPEMIQDPEWLFDVEDVNTIAACLKKAYSLSFEEYHEQVNQRFTRVRINNDMEKYYGRVINFVEEQFNETIV